jgi:hypothetical protein
VQNTETQVQNTETQVQNAEETKAAYRDKGSTSICLHYLPRDRRKQHCRGETVHTITQEEYPRRIPKKNTQEEDPRRRPKKKTQEEGGTHKLPTRLGSDGPNACT